MRRLAHKVHVTVLLALVLFGGLVVVSWHTLGDEGHDVRLVSGMAVILGEWLPPADADLPTTRAALARLSQLLPVQVALWTGQGKPVAATSDRVPPLEPGRTSSGWLHHRGPGIAAALHLPDGRWLVAVHRGGAGFRAAAGLAVVALLLTAVGLAALPLSRRLTRRLERLRARVEDLGGGDLSARVEVEGRDEVADLARSFNRAAARIQHLVEAQRSVLIGASHELRSPLARLRVALELLSAGGRADLKARVESDIAELDGLIDEILLSSRLEGLDRLEARNDDVDLLALAAEEGARTGAAVEGEAGLVLRGNERLLRRLVGELLQNAACHGDAASVAVTVQRAGDGLSLRVTDRGRGVPAAERERIFEPFYRPAGASESGRGYGLGLALVRRIARLHGGDARCVDAGAGGCCFEVDLPRLAPPATA